MRLSGTGAFFTGWLLAAPVTAQPTLQFFDEGSGVVNEFKLVLQVVSDETSPLSVELLLQDVGIYSLHEVAVADPTIFDTPLPAPNPLTGTSTSGLYFEGFGNDAFVSLQSAEVPPGVYDLLTLTTRFPVPDFPDFGFNGVEVSGAVTSGGSAFLLEERFGFIQEFIELPGDSDSDGDVDGDDLIAVQTNFGSVGPTPLLGDADFDGDVDGDDLIVVQANIGTTLGFFAVPEPTAASLLLFAVCLAPRRRRSTRIV